MAEESYDTAAGLYRPFREEYEFLSSFYPARLAFDGIVCENSKSAYQAQKLAETGSRPLLEGNHWGDTYWGIDLRTRQGENHLGRLRGGSPSAVRRAQPSDASAHGLVEEPRAGLAPVSGSSAKTPRPPPAAQYREAPVPCRRADPGGFDRGGLPFRSAALSF